jgi:hypothetical protein
MSAELHPLHPITEKELFERLERLERAVYVPMVSGEVAQWLDAVTKGIRELEEATCDYYRVVHTDVFQQMTELDPEQNALMQVLGEEDDNICEDLHSLAVLAEKLQAAGDQVEPDERLIATATKELSDRTIAIILRIRKHETEISTWHVEAMVRDRGPVD